MGKNLITVLIILVWNLVPASAFAQLATKGNYDPDKPIQIAADRLEADTGLGSARFVGNVVATQGDAVLSADLIVLRYGQVTTKPAQSGNEEGFLESLPARGGTDIQSLVATGRVKLVQGERKASCSQALYEKKTQTITLTGKPRLWQESDYLAGDKIIIHLDSERAEVISGAGSRVTAQILPSTTKAVLDEKAKQRLEDLKKNAPPSPGETDLLKKQTGEDGEKDEE